MANDARKDFEISENVFQRLVFRVAEASARGRLDAWLAKQCENISRVRIQQLIKEGRVTVDNRPVKATASLVPGSSVVMEIPQLEVITPEPENIPLDVLYEDSDCLVINKPAGLVVHPATGHPDGTLVNALLWHCSELGGADCTVRPGIVHRLDKDTSGLMVAVKSDSAMAGFIELFKTGAVRKEYLALVHGVPVPESGVLNNLIGRDPANRRRMTVVPVNGKDALTHYRVEHRIGDITLMHCRIETGRTHQIRVHMKSIGVPVIGDPLYGNPALDEKLSVLPQRQMLHARSLSFKHPVKGTDLSIEAPLPRDFKTYL